MSYKDAQMLLEGKGLPAYVNIQVKDVPASIGSRLNALHQAGERAGLSPPQGVSRRPREYLHLALRGALLRP